MSDPFLAEVKIFAGNFAPRGWALCSGQILSIAQNTALFSLLGTTYGGDGRTTFGLPDLRGRAPIGDGTGPGLTPRRLGQKSGQESVNLNTNQIPAHTHSATANAVTPGGDSNDAAGNFWADDVGVSSGTYHNGPANATMDAGAITVGNTGGNQNHENMSPFIVMNYIIALQGIFPSRS